MTQLHLFGADAPASSRGPGKADTALLLAMSPDHVSAASAAPTLRRSPTPQELAAQSFGEKGKRAWFWQDHSWQVGTAWEIGPDGRVSGMCRDYGPWGTRYPGSMPLQTHGRWPQSEVRWKRPASQYEGPAQP